MLDQIIRLIDHHPKLLIATLIAIIGVGTIGGGLLINVSLARIEAQASLHEQQLKLEQKKFEHLWITTRLRNEKIAQHLHSIETELNETLVPITLFNDESNPSLKPLNDDIQKLNASIQKMKLQLAEAKKEDEQLKKLEGVFAAGAGAAAGGLSVSFLLLGAGFIVLLSLATGFAIFRRNKENHN